MLVVVAVCPLLPPTADAEAVAASPQLSAAAADDAAAAASSRVS